MTQTNYREYHLSLWEYIIYSGIFFAVLIIVCLLFFNSVVPALLISPLILIYYKLVKRHLCEKRKNQLLYEFRDFINALSASLNSGYSLENSIKEAHREIQILHGSRSYMCAETDLMLKLLALNVPVEKVFADFAARCECADIITFSQILIIARRNGGDLISIIKSSSGTISEKIALKNDIATAIAAKQFEQNIMFVMPVAIMAYIRCMSKGYFDPVYGTPLGIIIMLFCLAGYIAAVLLGLKISKINI